MTSIPSSGGFKTESVSTSSGGVVMNLKGGASNGHTATLSTTFSGANGTYNVTLGYHDEQDGDSTLTTSIGGQQVDSFTLDVSGLGNHASSTNFMTRVFSGAIQVNNGDTIEITGVQETWDHANVDYIEFVSTGGSSNQAPTVSAGSDQSITLPSTANLTGSAPDDGLPNPPATVTTTWSTFSGPGTVSFGDSAALSTTASFSQAGTYVLRLTADDSALTSTDDVTITVGASSGSTVRMEAENMTSNPSSGGYKTENVSTSSGGVVMNLKGGATNGHTATLSDMFSGTTGTYDVWLGYHDEQDGHATLTTTIDAQQIGATLTLSASGLGTQPSSTNFMATKVGTAVQITTGDLIEITGVQGNWDHANVDYIEFVSSQGSSSPAIPTGLTGPAVDNDGVYTISWSASTNSTTYELERRLGSGSWSQVYSGALTSFDEPGLADGTYEYRVRGCNAVPECSAYSATHTTVVQPASSAPPTPTGLTGPTIDDDGSYTISWNASTGATTYELEQRLGTGSWSQVYSGSGTSDPQTVSVEGNYSYRVRACASACSDWSSTHTVEVDLAPQTPPPPTPPAPLPFNDPGQATSAETDTVGTTAGNFRVNESGAATYSIPIATAAGTAGVAPQISLNYSSSAGNGLVGQGWSIGGLSSISRCRQTFSQDDNVTALSFSSTDRFCLDGQRLVLTSSHNYGDAGSVYRTEIDSGAIVTIDSVVGGEPDSFSVERKDGSTSHYGTAPGSSDDSAKLQDASGRTLTYSIRRFEDSVGNPIWFDYTSTAGAQRISEIRWAYGASPGPNSGYNARLVFTYEARTDDILSYVDGSAFETDQRLSRIDSRNTAPGNSDSIIRTYHLNYNEGISTNDSLSRLTSIEECVGSTCLQNETTFSWNVPSTPAPSSVTTFEMGNNVVAFRPVDINGDGQMDLVWLRGNNSTKTLQYALSDGTNYSIEAFSVGGTTKSVVAGNLNPQLRVLDYNVDGRHDVAYWHEGDDEWRVVLAEPYGSGQWRLNATDVPTGLTSRAITFVDADSDGTTDAVYPRSTLTTNDLYVRRLVPNPSMAATPQSTTFYHFGIERRITGSGGPSTYGTVAAIGPDFNGDGQVDVLMGGDSEICDEVDLDDCSNIRNNGHLLILDGVGNNAPALSSYSSLQGVNIGGSLYYPVIDEVQVADLNQDGLSDLFYPLKALSGGDAVRFDSLINQGDGTFSLSQSLTDSSMFDENADVQLVDWNMDGYPDVLWRDVNGSSSVVRARYWEAENQVFGSIIHTVTGAVSGTSAETAQFFDVNGDAAADMVRINRNGNLGSTEVMIRQSAGTNVNVASNRIKEIVNGLGAKTEVDYEPLSWSSHYTRLEVSSTSGTGTFCEDHGPNEPVCYDEPVEVADIDAFYTAVNADDWDYPSTWQTLGKTSPVLEFSGPMYVVTRVTGDAPTAGFFPGTPVTNATSSIAYHYGEAKLQAAGRGFLGFRTLMTVDEQSQTKTTTRYRQDWPFSGVPIGTFTESSNGTLLSTSSSEWNALEWQSSFPATAESSGTAALGSLHVLQTKSTENVYDLVNNGLTAGALLSTVETETVYDIEGNVEDITVTTMNGVGTVQQTVFTDNIWHDSSVFTRFEGRLANTRVTTTRPAVSDPPLVRYSEFGYYTTGALKGLLRYEAIEPNRPEMALQTEHSYDSFGNLIQSAVTGDGVTRCAVNTATYDTISGRYVDQTQDCLGRLTSTVEARNVYGSPTQTRVYVDTNGTDYVEQRMSYSVLGREYYRYSSSGASSTQYLTDAPGNNCPAGTTTKALNVASTGAQTQTCMDKLGREIRALTRAFNGAWYAQDTEYDEYGRVRFKSEPYTFSITSPVWTTLDYDLLGRPTNTTLPDQSVSKIRYLGLTTEIENALAQIRTEVRNALGEVISVTDHAGGLTVFGYDHVGNMTLMRDDQVNETEMKYDRLGRKYEMTDPDKGTWEYEYNHFGEMVKQTDAKGQVQEMGYDGMGRMVSRVDRLFDGASNAQANAVWTYDTAPYGLGQLADMQDYESGYLEVYSYDSLGRQAGVATTIGADTYFESATFDEHGRAYQMFDAAGANHGIAYAYNTYGYLYRVADAIEVANEPRTVYQEIRAMNARGQVTIQWLGDGIVSTTFDYEDDTGRLNTIDSINTSVGTILQDLAYEWDSIGNLESREDSRGSSTLRENFFYDGLNRLDTYTVVGQGTITVGFDSIGNITSKSDVESGATYDYTGSGGPHAVSSIGSITYAYDNNGNMTSGDGRSISYTVFDKPSSISRGGHTTAFEYGPERSRYKRTDTGTSGTTTTRYVGNVEIITRPNGSRERKRYIGDIAIETVYFGFNSVEDSRETHYRLSDHLGSLGVAIDSTGNIVDSFAFDPWGQRRDATDWSALSSSALSSFDSTLTTRGFTGHEMLDAVGIIHMNGRIYDPKIARFVQADPFIQDPTNTQSLNRYSYVLNNPMNATDPSGYIVFTLAAAIALKSAEITAWNVVASVMFAAGFGDALFMGAGIEDALLAGLSNGAFWALGASFGPEGAFAGAQAHHQVLAFSALGGITSVIQGGRFGHGFRSSIASSVVGYFAGGLAQSLGERGAYIVQIVAGGTASELTGGKFANGAATAAFAIVTEAAFQVEEANGNSTPSNSDFKKNKSLSDNVTVDKSSGDVTIRATVSAESGQAKARDRFVKRVSGTKTVKSGCNLLGKKCSKSYQLTIELTAHSDGGAGDLHVVSRARLASRSPSIAKFLSDPANCTFACAIVGGNFLHINDLSLSGNKLTHELFHNLGFRHGNRPKGDFMHTESGKLRPSHIEEIHKHFGK